MGSIREKLFLEGKGVVSLVGAGGKTTLMFRLASELAEAGERVLTTTTTKISIPKEGQSSELVVSANVRDVIRRAEDRLSAYPHVSAAKRLSDSEGKLHGFDPKEIEQIWKAGLFQWILVEADGAAGRSLKAPADHEPVIPVCSSWVVAVVGLDVVGKPLDEAWVFRHEVFSRISGLPLGSPVTEESIAAAIEHERGLLKGCPAHSRQFLFLNKAEEDRAYQSAQRIGSVLSITGMGRLERILIGAARHRLRIVEWYGVAAG